MSPLVRRIFALVVGLHGLVHLIGFVVPWRLATLEGFLYTTSAAWDAVELGEAGYKLVGVAWLVVATAFVVAAVGLWSSRPWAWTLTTGAALASLPLCILGSPQALAGIFVNVAILVAIGVGRKRSRPMQEVTR
jgi:hypothetical protein